MSWKREASACELVGGPRSCNGEVGAPAPAVRAGRMVAASLRMDGPAEVAHTADAMGDHEAVPKSGTTEALWAVPCAVAAAVAMGAAAAL